MEDKEETYIEMLVVYKDDMDISRTKMLIPVWENNVHYGFINRESKKVEFINKQNIIRMEESCRVSDINIPEYTSVNICG